MPFNPLDPHGNDVEPEGLRFDDSPMRPKNSNLSVSTGLSTATGGAVLGTLIAGPIGGAVGAVVGGAAGLYFSGSKGSTGGSHE